MTRHSNNLNHRVNTRRGFSLVELLVVIAIITVLLSILMPSLQGARYATKLTVCQANLHSMGVGIAVYGNEHNGYYPHRTVNESAANPRHHRLADKKNNRTLFDDRPMFAPYFDVSLFDCPLSPGPAAGMAEIDTTDARIVTSSYEMYFGSRLVRADGATAMQRQGDTIRWDNQRYRVLMADSDMKEWHAKDDSTSAHQSRTRDMWVDQVETKNNWWSLYRETAEDRGPIDRNFLMDDGSVRTLNNLVKDDSRVHQLPGRPANHRSRVYVYLPAN